FVVLFYFFFQAEDGIRYRNVTGVQTCALPLAPASPCGPCSPVSPLAPFAPVSPLAPASPRGPCGPSLPATSIRLWKSVCFGIAPVTNIFLSSALLAIFLTSYFKSLSYCTRSNCGVVRECLLQAIL